MDLHLHNMRTGETFKLAADQTLIGAAEHAAVGVEVGPYLAALAVRYPSGWALFGLADDGVTFRRQPLRPGERVAPRKGDLFTVGDERFTFVSPQDGPDEDPPPPEPPPVCLLYVLYPDGKEECRAVDHDLLFGRLEYCHIQFADTRLSRLNALLACDEGAWYAHNLTKKFIGRNKKPVRTSALVADGDELLIGPLVVRVELHGVGEAAEPAEDRAARLLESAFSDEAGAFAATDASEDTADGTGEHPAAPNLDSLREHAQSLDEWLKGHPPRPPEAKGGLGGWFGAQRDKLRRFWLDTPETTSARSLRASGKVDDAFAVLDRAIRARPDSPNLLRELYRLYDALGMHDLCYRPLRQIEKLAEVRGEPDPWVLETLARVCERLSVENPSMTERALKYWTKLEEATGTSHNREKANVLARRALRDGGYGTSGNRV